MDFQKDSPIWRQISDQLGDEILQARWKEGERIPSVRERAADLGVNPNTVIRAYGALEEAGVIVNQRGLGYFVATGGTEKLRAARKQEFLEKEWPLILKKMAMLGLTASDKELWK